MTQELTADEQRQAQADLNLGMQLAIDERDLNARADLQKRAGEIAKNIADERRARQVDAISAGAASAEAAQQARADEAEAEAEGAPLTPGDDVAKAAAAGQAAEAEVTESDTDTGDTPVHGQDTDVRADDKDVSSLARQDAAHTIDVEGPDQGDTGDRANAKSNAKAAKTTKSK